MQCLCRPDIRHLATRVVEHRKVDSPVGQHLLECNKEVGGTAEELKSEIIDQTANTHKLLTLEVELHPLHVSLYTTLDLSSRAKEVLRDGKHVFNFLVVKIICAPDIIRTFAANS